MYKIFGIVRQNEQVNELPSDVPLNSLRTHIISPRYRIRVEFRRRESLPLAVKTSIIIYSNHYQQCLRSFDSNNLQKTLW